MREKRRSESVPPSSTKKPKVESSSDSDSDSSEDSDDSNSDDSDLEVFASFAWKQMYA